MKVGILLLVILVLFAACARQPVMTVKEAHWRKEIQSGPGGGSYTPKTGYKFLVADVSLDFGTETALRTEDISVSTGNGKSYGCQGGNIGYLPPGDLALGQTGMTSPSGQFFCILVFTVPIDSTEPYALQYRRGMLVSFSVQ